MDVAKAYAQQAVNYVLPGKCYNDLAVKLNFANSDCTSLAISRLLGVAITAGSCLLFLPQIIKIQAAGSAKGSFIAFFRCYQFFQASH